MLLLLSLQSKVAAMAMMWQCQRLDTTHCSSITDASNCMELPMQSLQSPFALQSVAVAVAVAVAMMLQCQRHDATRCSSVTDASN